MHPQREDKVLTVTAVSPALEAWIAGALHWAVLGQLDGQPVVLDCLTAAYGGSWIMGASTPDGEHRVTWKSLACIKAGDTVEMHTNGHPFFARVKRPAPYACAAVLRFIAVQHRDGHPDYQPGTPGLLDLLCWLLGWQGGTIHAALEATARYLPYRSPVEATP